MRLTNRALRYMRDSNAAACAEIDAAHGANPSPYWRGVFNTHRAREVWARERIAKRTQRELMETRKQYMDAGKDSALGRTIKLAYNYEGKGRWDIIDR